MPCSVPIYSGSFEDQGAAMRFAEEHYGGDDKVFYALCAAIDGQGLDHDFI